MAKYRKTALIDASQWWRLGDHEAVVFCPGNSTIGVINTLEGQLTVQPGTWIAGPGAKGEFWPIDDEVFRATYELAE